jgi:plasmid stabilization system protein ParE
MDLEVCWTQFAENKLTDIFDYYKEKAGIRVAQKLVTEIVKESLLLEKTLLLDKKKIC